MMMRGRSELILACGEREGAPGGLDLNSSKQGPWTMRYGTTHSPATARQGRQERPKRFLEGGRVATWRMAWHETAADLSLGKEGSGRRVKAWAWTGMDGMGMESTWRMFGGGDLTCPR